MLHFKFRAVIAPLLVRSPLGVTFSPNRSTAKYCSSTSSSGVWPGLDHWRSGPPNGNRVWGDVAPEYQPPPSLLEDESRSLRLRQSTSLAELGSIVLSTSDPVAKAILSHLAFSRWHNENLPVGSHAALPFPARPEKPQLVSPKEIPSPKDSGMPLNAYLLHNLAHVELNAIDLAWDTVVRFSPLCDTIGEAFFHDFARVADDESRHFSWCCQRLGELGYRYGDLPAHNVLWRECAKSSDNVAARMAVIPLVQEARGLDAGPRLVQKLVGSGDTRSSKIVAKIAEEEVAHVAVGVYWFLSVCDKMGRAPTSTFRELLRDYDVQPKGPFNYAAREEAGIPRHWYDPECSNKTAQQLSLVHDRLSAIIEMECNNASS